MEVPIKTTVHVDARTLAESMSYEDIALFCSYVAERVDGDFKDRATIAKEFSDGLSEQGCRFIAEVVMSHYSRAKSY